MSLISLTSVQEKRLCKIIWKIVFVLVALVKKKKFDREQTFKQRESSTMLRKKNCDLDGVDSGQTVHFITLTV